MVHWVAIFPKSKLFLNKQRIEEWNSDLENLKKSATTELLDGAIKYLKNKMDVLFFLGSFLSKRKKRQNNSGALNEKAIASI